MQINKILLKSAILIKLFELFKYFNKKYIIIKNNDLFYFYF